MTAGSLAQTVGLTRETLMKAILPRLGDKGVVFLNQAGRGPLSGLGLRSDHIPLSCSGSVAEAIAISQMPSSGRQEALEPLGFLVEDLAAIRPETKHFRRMCRILGNAAAQKRAIEGVYVGKQGASKVVFSPHALVRTVHRVHWRGYAEFDDSGKGGFVDLLPERFQGCSFAAERDDTGYVSGKEDIDWNTHVEVFGKLNHALPKAMQEAVREEQRSEDTVEEDLIRVRTRKALARYVALWIESRTLLNTKDGKEIKVWLVDRPF